jgi:hypothetical protein
LSDKNQVLPPFLFVISSLFVIPEAGVPGERTCSLGWEGNPPLARPASSEIAAVFN